MIRVAKLKILGDMDDWPAIRRQLSDLAEDVKRATNLIWRTWMEWHSVNGSAPVIRKYMNELRAWHNADKTERGEKPKCSVMPIDKACSKAIYKALHAAFPGVHNRVLELTRQCTTKRIRQYKPYRGSFAGWMRVLLDDDRPAFSSQLQPLRVDKSNCSLVKDGGEWYLVARLQRLSDGKSVAYRFHLATRGKHAATERAKLEKVLSGEYAAKGSMIDFNSKDRCWYAKIGFELPTLPKIDADPQRTAHLIPHRRRPWVLWCDGFDWYVGGRTGRHVFHVRRQLLTQRWGRQEAYRVASSARKGRGKQRGYDAAMNTLRRRWQDFVKTQSEAATVEVLRVCGRKGIGRVVFYQPCGSTAENRFLATAGKVPGRHDSSTWDWYRMGALLSRKCQENGIKCEVVKCGEAESSRRNGAKLKREPVLQ